ncbi:hypothetical protein GCM10023205_35370 [Yinghuangia aomiensis]|uniref:Uncharacterized protein n=1 Tax=Yinghuangia aomiensis TaxID=676205 RepID=A0ABP9HCG3_9ACTN
MTPEETVGHLAARLHETGFTVQQVQIGPTPTYMGHKRVMHWPTLTSMHVFTAIGQATHPQYADTAAYTHAVLHYASKHKPGLPLGLQTGVLAPAFLVVPATDDEMRHIVAERMPPRRFAAIGESVLVDAHYGRYLRHQGRRLVGGAYNKTISRTIEATTAGILLPG